MDEKSMNKFYELYLDMLQDARTDAQAYAKYEMIIDMMFNNVQLNWNKNGLTLKSDTFIDAILKGLDPIRYKEVLKELQEKRKNEEEE